MIGNFISVSKATNNGLIVKFNEKNAVISDRNGKVILKAQRNENLYLLNPSLNSLALSSTSNILHWHNRYGHLNFKSLSDLSRKQIVNGLQLNGTINEINCRTCMQSKICSLPFPSASDTRSKNILDLIHTDLCGPMPKPSIGGSRYFITFIDDNSRKIFVYFLKTKDEAFEKFKIFKNLVECQTERKIKAIRSDNGKEYVNKNWNNLLEASGIKRQLTVPHTPQQNGVAERANRTIVEMARSMMIHAGVSEELWAEAVNTAIHIRNRAVSNVLGNKTPQEIWSGRVPSVQHFRVFGSPAIALDKTQKHKFTAKGKEYIFVGYSLTSKAYRLYDKTNRKIVEKRDVKFDENALEKQDEIWTSEEQENENIHQPISRNQVKKALDNKSNEEEVQVQSAEEKPKENKNKEQEKQSSESESDDMATAEEEESEEIIVGPGRPKLIRTGKPGRPKKQFNILNLLKTQGEDYVPQSTYEALHCAEAQKWLNAMEEEYDALISNNTWSLVELPKGQKTISSRWVFSKKRDENGNIKSYKSRLVAKGINYTETFSPVVRHATIRLVMAMAVELQMHLHQMDVSCAYLNGELTDEIYMTQPEMFVDKNLPNHVLKLKKSLYGLKQSGRAWNAKLDEVLTKLGFIACVSEPCLYLNKNEGFNIITVYVDDLIIGSTNEIKLNKIKDLISAEFRVVDGGSLHHFLGLEIHRQGPNGAISISQQQYIKNLLKKHNLKECRSVATPLEVGYQTNCDNQNCKTVDPLVYQSLIGELTHLAVLTRPDIMPSVSKLAQRNCNPHQEHMTAAKHILRYLSKTIELQIHYKKTGEPIKGYSDADWGGDVADRKS